MDLFLKESQKELTEKGMLYLKIKVIPKANRTEFREVMGDGTVKMGVKAPPVDGKANGVLEKFLRKEFGAAEVRIVSGQRERVKLVKLVGSK